MSSSLKKCTTIHAKRRFVLEEKRSKVIFNNSNSHGVKEIIVDGCAITRGPRCDYLVIIDALDTSIFVELKGSNVEYAVNQITASQQKLTRSIKKVVIWIVSSTRCPLTSTEVQNLALKIQKRMNATLIVRNTPVSFKL